MFSFLCLDSPLTSRMSVAKAEVGSKQGSSDAGEFLPVDPDTVTFGVEKMFPLVNNASKQVKGFSTCSWMDQARGY